MPPVVSEVVVAAAVVKVFMVTMSDEGDRSYLLCAEEMVLTEQSAAALRILTSQKRLWSLNVHVTDSAIQLLES
ncbi:hypothetical protein Tco_0660100 [Tanacetum coccineum]